MNKVILDKIADLKDKVATTYNKTTEDINTAATSTYNNINKSLTEVSNIKNKISVISDMFTDLRVLNGTAKNIIYLSTLPIVENEGIKLKNDKYYLDTLIKTNKEISVKDSSISSVEKYTLSTLDKKRTSIDTFLKSSVETLIEFPNNRYTFSLNLRYPTVEQINSLELQLGLLTDSYPIISSIKYIDKDNVEQTAVILNNTSTNYDLDYNRELDNKYTLDLSTIITDQINIEFTSKVSSSLIIKEVKTYFKKEVNSGEIIVGPVHTQEPLLKVALDCDELSEGCTFEFSTDLDYWLPLDSSSIITDKTNTKILSFNTVNSKSIKTTEDIYTFYIKINIESKVLTNDDMNINIYKTLREDNIISTDTLSLVDDNLFSAYKLKSSDFVYGDYQYTENLNIKDFSKEIVEYIEVNGTSKVLGLIDTPYSITDTNNTNNLSIGCELKFKRLDSEFIIDSRNYDLANSKIYDIYPRYIEETINIKQKDNLCFMLKGSYIQSLVNTPSVPEPEIPTVPPISCVGAINAFEFITELNHNLIEIKINNGQWLDIDSIEDLVINKTSNGTNTFIKIMLHPNDTLPKRVKLRSSTITSLLVYSESNVNQVTSNKAYTLYDGQGNIITNLGGEDPYTITFKTADFCLSQTLIVSPPISCANAAINFKLRTDLSTRLIEIKVNNGQWADLHSVSGLNITFQPANPGAVLVIENAENITKRINLRTSSEVGLYVNTDGTNLNNDVEQDNQSYILYNENNIVIDPRLNINKDFTGKYFDDSGTTNDYSIHFRNASFCLSAANTSPTDPENPDPIDPENPDPTEPPVLNNFDYVVMRYIWTDAGGRDLDTRTRIVGRNVDVGWNRSDSDGTYLTWGGDNTGSGIESVLSDLLAYSSSNPQLTDITLELRAFWYSTVASGNINIEFTSYNGGTMQKNGLNFINVGGIQTAQEIISVNTMLQTGSNNDGTLLARLIYNVATKSAQLIKV